MGIIKKLTKMKTAFAVIAALVAIVPTTEAQSDKLHFFDFDNAKMLYKGDWAAYKKTDHTITIAPSLSPITGRVPNNALSPGNAEALECAREEDGAPVSSVAKDPHSHPQLQVSPPPTERLIGLRT